MLTVDNLWNKKVLYCLYCVNDNITSLFGIGSIGCQKGKNDTVDKRGFNFVATGF